MGRTGKAYGKNNWALFLLILAGFVLGSFVGHLTKDVNYLSWLNYSLDFSIGDTTKNNTVCLNLGALVLQFGLLVKISIGSVIGAVASIFVYKAL